ncbi:MAG: hypothetical protein COT73_00180 [Bdellovibrio sp. CG10_big_fil_rev_8_21_14_0_10_47_8]|nr:MAG: hypothetical protein COT73_00180 [Bdellovibrio sp. CG10_big_fil_rev_8_21_14_0_10_47_8]
MKIRWILPSLMIISTSSQALAGRVNWNAKSKDSSYLMLAVGTGVALSGNASSQLNERMFLVGASGSVTAGIGALNLVGQMTADLTDHPDNGRILAAEHRALVRAANKIKAGYHEFVDPTFDRLLSFFECSSCRDDLEKAKAMAESILSCDQKGKEIVSKNTSSPISADTENDIINSAKEQLGENSTDNNNLLSRRLTALAIVSAQQEH